MINFLSDKLSSAVNKLSHAKLTPQMIDDILHEVKIAFLDSDVNYTITNQFISSVRDELADEKIVLKRKKYKNKFVMQVMQERMIKILDNQNYKLRIKKKPTFLMFVGLQGCGKTTTVAKIANYYKKKFKSKILVVACDVHRPAASLQLKKLCDSIRVKVLRDTSTMKMTAVEIAEKGVELGKEGKYDIVLFDTAGRTIEDKAMIREIVNLKKIVRPTEMIFVVDAMIGQAILPTAEFFNKRLSLTSAILTKFDSESRSGSAFTLSYQAKIPIVFVGIGEKIHDLEKYHPERIVKQILGLGDLDTFFEKAEKNFSLKATEGVFKQMMSSTMSLDTIIKQMEGFTKMGPLKSIVRLLPGLPKMPVGSEDKFRHHLKILKAISNSATPEERSQPKLLSEMTRKIRILKGSGIKGQDYNKLLKQITQFISHSSQLKELFRNSKK